jgi:microcystin-dependent protein
MASVLLSPFGNGQQFFDDNGVPLAGGLIYTYQAGSSTPLATYTTNGGTIANSNPIVLDATGRVPNEIWLFTGYSYKFILKNSDDVTIQTLDDIYPILQNAPESAPAIPTGGIIIWSGSTGSVPSGWLLCDGTNGTPDLRDRFIIGAGNTYAVNATGGTADAVVVSHTHTATSVVDDPGHTHSSNAVAIQSAPGNGFPSTGSNNIPATINSVTTGITVATTNASTGVSGTNANLPPYYALAYIMKG